MTTLRTAQMLSAMENEDWPAVRAYMQTILDIDPRNRRSPEPEADYSRKPPLEYAPPPVQYVVNQQDEDEDFWEVDHQHPMPALHALNEDDWGAVENYQPVINNIKNEDDWGYQPVKNNQIIINNNNNVAVENDWGDWAGEDQGAAVISPPPSPDFQQN